MSTVIKFPTTMQGWTGTQTGSQTWTGPDNSKVSDGVYATSSCGGDITTSTSVFLYHHNFVFGIGAGATINGVTVEIKIKSDDATTCTISKVQLTSTTAASIGTAKAANTVIPVTDTIITLGNSTDLWGATITQANTANAGFGFILQVTSSDTINPHTISVDYGKMTIDYNGGAVAIVDFAGAVFQWVTGYPSSLAF